MHEWTGRDATALRKALHTTEARFARSVGVSERTVANWAADPGTVPRSNAQDALEQLYTGATQAVRTRYEQLVSGEPSAGNVQALRIAIAIVLRDGQVLLVRRRDESGGIGFGFVAGIVKPGESAENVAVNETLKETGVHCSVVERIGARVHPVTGVLAEYFKCSYLAGDAANLDTVENAAVIWAARSDVSKFIERSSIYAPVLLILEGQHV